MSNFGSIIVGIIIILLILSGLFDFIEWKFNLIALAVVVIVWIVAMYNGLIRGRTHVREAWADIDVQLKRRYNLIPNLVNAVKGYATHEREAFENVTKARSAAMSAGTVTEHGKTENILSGTLKSLFALSEAYPDLKANQNFMELQKELSDTENKIQSARRFYNNNVKDYNIGVQSVPTNIIASMFKFKREDFFELEIGAAAREVPEVKL